MKLNKILLDGKKNMSEEEIAKLLPPREKWYESNDYILPVTMTSSQRELLDPVISAYYSEIMSYYDSKTTDERKRKSEEVLRFLRDDLLLLCTHPFLLIDHYIPSRLLHRDTPNFLGQASGKFMALGYLARLLSPLKLNVGIVSRAGVTVDLLEAFLMDKPVNVQRYTGIFIKGPRTSDPNLTMFHLVPSKLESLTAAINAAFDCLIIMDESFDLTSEYAMGLRAQLRNAQVQKQYAPVIRLVPLYTLAHAELCTESLSECIGAAIVLRHCAGALPSYLRPIYDHELYPLLRYFHNTDGPWPLERPGEIRRYSHTDVLRSMMSEVKVEPEPSDVRLITNPANSAFHKRARVEETDNMDRLTHEVLVYFVNLVAIKDLQAEELSELRNSASRRQSQLEEVQAELANYVRKVSELEKKLEASEKRAARLRQDSDILLEKTHDLEDRWKAALNEAHTESDDPIVLRRLLLEEQEKVKAANKKYVRQTSEIEYLRAQYQTASTAAAEVAAEKRAVETERDEYKLQATGKQIELRKLVLDAELKQKDQIIAGLKGELANCKESLRIMMEERQSHGRDRTRNTRRNGYN